MMHGMEWLIASGLLVAVWAWVAELCHRLLHLRAGVQGAWQQWVEATHRRNDCLIEVAAALAPALPREDVLPRVLRRLAEDSDRLLREQPQLPWGGVRHAAVLSEAALRRQAQGSWNRVAQQESLQWNEGLRHLRELWEDADAWQRQSERVYGDVAGSYNAALREPPVRALAGMLGFRRVGTFPLWEKENHPSAVEADG